MATPSKADVHEEALKDKLLLLAKPMLGFPGAPGEPYRQLVRCGVLSKKTKSSAPASGADKRCFDNALSVPLPMCCGYAMDVSLGLPIAHCWNVDAKGKVVESTPVFSAADVIYFGMPVDKAVAQSVREASSHGNEFMDCWRSAVANVSTETANQWRSKLGWNENIESHLRITCARPPPASPNLVRAVT